MKFTVTLNGEVVDGDVEPRVLLAAYLREERGLTGVKLSCEAGICGACTVLMDGLPVSSCSTLAVDSDRCAVTTIEGVGTTEALHPLQQAFASTVAFQCGFCTPGMVMAAVALLAENPDPTEDEDREGLEGNFCRCTGYHNIVRAVRAAAAAVGDSA